MTNFCNKLLLLIDVQNDFLENGALPIPNSNSIITPINQLIKSFRKHNHFVWATADNHPQHHISFASTLSLPNFTFVDGKILWPDHCIKNSFGQQFPSNLLTTQIQRVFYKGTNVKHESLSAISDDENRLLTLYFAIKKAKIKYIYVVGLAFEFCVISTISDIIKYFPEIKIVCDMNCTRSVDTSDKSIKKLVRQYRSRVYFHNFNNVFPDTISENINNIKTNGKKTTTKKKYCCKNKKLSQPETRQFLYALATIIAIGIIITIIILST